GCSGYEYDLAVGMAFLEFLVGIADIVEVVDAGDGDLEAAFVDEVGEFGEDAGFGAFGVAFCFHMMFVRGFEVDDGVDAFRLDAERDGDIYISIAVSVDEGIDPGAGRLVRGARLCGAAGAAIGGGAPGGGFDAFRHAFAIGHGDTAMPGDPLMVALARQPNHAGAEIPRQLDDDRAHTPCGAGDHERL